MIKINRRQHKHHNIKKHEKFALKIFMEKYRV